MTSGPATTMGAVLADIFLVLLVFWWIFEQMFEKYRPQLTGASGPIPASLKRGNPSFMRDTPLNNLTFNYFAFTIFR
jgi:hypothetical protein